MGARSERRAAVTQRECQREACGSAKKKVREATSSQKLLREPPRPANTCLARALRPREKGQSRYRSAFRKRQPIAASRRMARACYKTLLVVPFDQNTMKITGEPTGRAATHRQLPALQELQK